MKKTITIVVIIIILIFVVRFIFGGSEDSWICDNGQWIKHGAPSSQMPTDKCGSDDSDHSDEIIEPIIWHNMIKVSEPLPESEVTSPLIIKGEARGNWFFEGDFPVVLTNWDGLIIAQGIAQAQGEWMTEEFVQFEAILEFDLTNSVVSSRGSLILQKDNPSDLPEFDDAYEFTVFLK
ncbi:MAG: Gmad2 immunoglobulin-like domain-containing protein [Patescibacteria group bacterium]